jgi:hypothetical protein
MELVRVAVLNAQIPEWWFYWFGNDLLRSLACHLGEDLVLLQNLLQNGFLVL